MALAQPTANRPTSGASLGWPEGASPAFRPRWPSSSEHFIYLGLPARRWKTFWLESTPIEDVRDSKVPLFVVQGTRDDSTLSADLLALEAIRQQPNRPLRYVVLDQGDHAFETPDGNSHLAELLDDFVAGRSTAIDRLLFRSSNRNRPQIRLRAAGYPASAGYETVIRWRQRGEDLVYDHRSKHA
jgi:hypothetical protein